MQEPNEEELLDALTRWKIKGVMEEYDVPREVVMSWLSRVARRDRLRATPQVHPWNQWATAPRLGRLLGIKTQTISSRANGRSVRWPQYERRTQGNTYEYRIAPGGDPYVSVDDESDLVAVKKMLAESTAHRQKLSSENDDLRAQLFEANRIIDMVRLGEDHAPIKTSPRDRQLLKIIEQLDRRIKKLENEKEEEAEVVLVHEVAGQEMEHKTWTQRH